MERLDFETLFRIVRWDYNRCFKDESLDKDLFMGKYGKVMGEHYYNKFVHEFDGNILKMVGYFRGSEKEGQVFCDMITERIEKYERAKTELSYTDIWGAFGNMMDYIQFFNMGTAKSILKKSANDWLGTNHELSKSEDSIKRKHVHELKRIFQILLDHQGLKVLGTVNVIVDEVCGEGTWIKYSERSERWRKGEEERERIKLERLRKEEEARYKDFDEKLEEWKSGEINFLNTPFYIPGEKPNAWIRIKGNIIETSKQIKIGIAEARKLWRAVSAMHRGAEFRHGLVEDVTSGV